MQSNLLSYSFSKSLNGVVDIVFYGFNEKSITVRVVNIHIISGLLQIYATALVPMNQNHK